MNNIKLEEGYKTLMEKYGLTGDVVIHTDNDTYDGIESFEAGDLVNGFPIESSYYSGPGIWQGHLIAAPGPDITEDGLYYIIDGRPCDPGRICCEIIYSDPYSEDLTGRYGGPSPVSVEQAKANILAYMKETERKSKLY